MHRLDGNLVQISGINDCRLNDPRQMAAPELIGPTSSSAELLKKRWWICTGQREGGRFEH
jgi:hypothetical protein